MSKYDKFFELAKAAGIEEAELYIGEHRDLSISVFHGQVENYSDNNGLSIFARGIINGKCGSASCDVWNKDKAQYLVNQIKSNAGVIENDDPIVIFKGSNKYHKVNTFNKILETISINEKMSKLFDLEKAIKNYDKRVAEVAEINYEESCEKVTLLNTNGLKLSSKTNYFVYMAQCVVKEGNQTKSNYDYFIDNDFSKFDVNKLAAKIAKDALDQLNGEACKSGKYAAVLSPNVVNSLIRVYVGHASSEEVQKGSSLFKDSLGKKIASSKVTIEDRPLQKNVYSRWFDDEGVATYNKPIIKNGTLETFLYNLTTAAKENRESTGNGFGVGSKKEAAPSFIYLKPGRKSQQELFEKMGNGVFITEVSGLHAGMNPQSGSFSLQSSGYIIENGKRGRSLDLITVSGNLMDIFKDVVDVGNDITISASSSQVESILIKKIMVSGK